MASPPDHPPRRDPDAWIAAIADLCERAASGDLEGRLLHNDAEGDLGRAVDAVNALLDVVDAFVREARVSLDCAANDQFHRRILSGGLDGSYLQASQALNRATDQMQRRYHALQDAQHERFALADSFEESVGDVVSAVASAATELRATAGALGETAEATEGRAAAATRDARHASTELGGAVDATHAVSDAARRIDQEGTAGADDARQAERAVEEGRRRLEGLQSATATIGETVQAIRAIARQTNLLALNASIEAARAGAAGRGFGVVANEVKELARQTATATTAITARVQEIGEGTRAVTQAFDEVGGTVEALARRTQAIHAGTEQQLDAVDRLHATLETVASHAATVARHTEEVLGDTGQTAAGVTQVQQAAEELARHAEQLRSDVERFLERVRVDETQVSSEDLDLAA